VGLDELEPMATDEASAVVISPAAIVPHAGAADTVPVPVCVRKFLVAVVLPARAASVFVPEP
jgi:mRNA-degrading endonuclease toxin of MazEF toxin-antitoxin module